MNNLWAKLILFFLGGTVPVSGAYYLSSVTEQSLVSNDEEIVVTKIDDIQDNTDESDADIVDDETQDREVVVDSIPRDHQVLQEIYLEDDEILVGISPEHKYVLKNGDLMKIEHNADLTWYFSQFDD